MIHLTEDLLYELIRNEILHIKQHPEELDNNFILGGKSRIDKLKTYLTTKTNKLYVEHSYPRELAKLPAICIILGGESSEPEGLGSELFEEEFESFSEDVIEVKKSTYNHVNTPVIQLDNYPVVEVKVVNKNGNELTKKAFDENALSRGILIPKEVALIFGEEYTITYKYIKTTTNDIGQQYTVNFRLEVYSDNADLNVMLYSLIKYILIKNTPFLEEKGYRLINLSGTDFEPLPDYFPAVFLYRRSILLTAKVVESVKAQVEFTQALKLHQELYETMEEYDITIEQLKALVKKGGK